MSTCKLRASAMILVLAMAASIQAGEIHEAVKSGDETRVVSLIDRDPDLLNARDETGKAPLHWAARGSNLEIVRFLVDRGADLNAVDGNGIAPLHSLASRGNADGARILLAKGADVNIRAPNQSTPLHFAVLGKQAGILALLVENKADLESRDEQGRTPLIVAAREMAGPDVVRKLLDLGAQIDAVDRFGASALSLAAWRGSADVVGPLMERGAGLPVDTRQKARLLERAVSNGLNDLFFRMVREGADLQARTDGGATLLAAAAEGGSVPIIEVLIAKGLDVNERDENGWAPLHFAADLGRSSAVALLLDKGADIGSRTIMGQSAYNLAEDNGDEETMKLLVSKGADPGPAAFPTLTEAYLGQKPPGMRAEVFAPGIVSARFGLHSNVVFSPDGNEAFWSMMIPPRTVGYGGDRTVVSRFENGRWTYPREAIFDGTKLEDVPFFHPDGKTLYDMARRPLPGMNEAGKENIWAWQRGPGGWNNPRPLPAVINDLPHHWQFSVDRGGDLYFSTNVPGSAGGNDIYVSRLVKGQYQQPENLGESINTEAGEGFPFISPDGGTLLFGRNMDIYVSFRTEPGTWTRGRSLGRAVNTPGMELLPILSSDGRFLFFSRDQDSWWIDAGFIEDLRAVELSRVGKTSAAEQIAQVLEQGGVENARARFSAMQGDANAFYVDEAEINLLGYRFMGERRIAEAMTVFEMNTRAFPDSWNVWDSLAEACSVAGDRAKAIAFYGKSVEINPDNQNGKDALSRLRGYELDESGETKEGLRFEPGAKTGLQGPYLGQTAPGSEPVVFAPGVVSSAAALEFSIAFTPDGREIYFTRRVEPDGMNTLMVSRLEAGGWTAPEEAAFSRGFPSNEPHITPDGRKLYFGSRRPRPGSEQAEFGSWVVDRATDHNWSQPRYHGPGMYVSASRNGNLYTTDITNVAGGGAIVYPWDGGHFGTPRRLGGGVNAPRPADHSFIAPDESYILFDSYFRPGGQGGEGDLWVSFRMPDGNWSEALNLGDAINTPATEFCPMVSPDGQYIFFSTRRDIYWVSAKILDELRVRALGVMAARIPRP